MQPDSAREPSRRGLDELIIPDSRVWAEINTWSGQGANRILDITPEDGRARLRDLQLTTQSSQGAMTLNCGAILADHGWLKLFGGGTEDIPSLPAMVSGIDTGQGAGLCGVDVLGGVFAINWGAFPGEEHRLWYWAIDTLDWEACGEWKHIDLLYYSLTGQMDKFYADLRWPGWQDDTRRLAVDEGYTLDPPPYSVEGRNTSQARRAVVPMAEVCRAMHGLTRPGGLFAKTSPTYPMFWTRGRHYRPETDRFITLSDLVDVEAPLWRTLEPLIAGGPHRVLPADPVVAQRRLEHLEHGLDTGIGAMVYHCAGMIVDHGWLRLFGSGTDDDDSRDLVGGLSRGEAWLVGYDVLGGVYAINLGGFDAPIGQMMHWSTATTQWHPMGFTYEEFLRWALSGGLTEYYRDLRWPGWELTVENLPLDHGVIHKGQPTPMNLIVEMWTKARTTHFYPMAWA